MNRLLVATLSCLGIGLLAPACIIHEDSGVDDLCPADFDKLAPGACGCGIPDVDNNGNGLIDCLEGTAVSSVSATWTLVSGDNNDPAGCPVGATTISLTSRDTLGQDYIDLFDCADGAGITDVLPPGDYLTWIKLTDDTGEVLYAQSLSYDVAVYDNAASPIDFEFSIDRGVFTVSWQVQEAGAASDCAAVGGTSVSLVSTDEASDFWDDVFTCTDYQAMTAGLHVGAFTESMSLLDNSELAIATASTVSASIDYGNHYSDLGIVLLDPAGP